MKSLILCFAIFSSFALHECVASVAGNCPKVNLPEIKDLNSVLGLWWRPFRSQMAKDEPEFKCLSTEWKNLKGRTFDVIDNNVELKTGAKSTWTGTITATESSNADWNIELSNGMKVSAQILDMTSSYMLMYSCLQNQDESHDERGIIFIRDKNLSLFEMRKIIRRSERVFKSNNLNHVNMLRIPLNDCDN